MIREIDSKRKEAYADAMHLKCIMDFNIVRDCYIKAHTFPDYNVMLPTVYKTPEG